MLWRLKGNLPKWLLHIFRFSDMDSDSFIDFEKTKYGHIKISGQLGMTFRNNYLMFEIDAGQTVITNLIKRLK